MPNVYLKTMILITTRRYLLHVNPHENDLIMRYTEN